MDSCLFFLSSHHYDIHRPRLRERDEPNEASLALPELEPLKMARVYADVNQQMPRAYWDYDSVNISWGVLENYEVVRKIGRS